MDTQDLDFTNHFSPGYTEPDPYHSVEDLRKIDELGVIGESALKASGFYARILSSAPPGRARAPADTHVLVVEDDNGTAAVIVKVLDKMGYPTRRARDLREVVSALMANPKPNLILLDVVLPDADGFELLKRIRSHSKLKHIPVLMLTSLSDRKDIARGLGLGADGYVTKPALPSTLIDAVQAISCG